MIYNNNIHNGAESPHPELESLENILSALVAAAVFC